jgi:hypothetical protein
MRMRVAHVSSGRPGRHLPEGALAFQCRFDGAVRPAPEVMSERAVQLDRSAKVWIWHEADVGRTSALDRNIGRSSQ